jgi:hypothetical protein
LLNEFERGGTSGAQFADYVGIKYSSFVTWIQKRQRRRASGVEIGHQSRVLIKDNNQPKRGMTGNRYRQVNFIVIFSSGVTKEAVGIHVLPKHSSFDCDIVRRMLSPVSRAKPTSAPLQF